MEAGMAGMPSPQASAERRLLTDLADDIHPEQYPEARRELQIANGAFASLEVTVRELLTKLADYTRDTEPDAMKEAMDPSLPVRSPFGRALREHSDQIGRLERQVRAHLNLLEL